MSRKHYEAIAAAFNSTRPAVSVAKLEQWADDVLTIARWLADGNPRFDRERFLTACGY